MLNTASIVSRHGSTLHAVCSLHRNVHPRLLAARESLGDDATCRMPNCHGRTLTSSSFDTLCSTLFALKKKCECGRPHTPLSAESWRPPTAHKHKRRRHRRLHDWPWLENRPPALHRKNLTGSPHAPVEVRLRWRAASNSTSLAWPLSASDYHANALCMQPVPLSARSEARVEGGTRNHALVPSPAPLLVAAHTRHRSPSTLTSSPATR